MTPLCWARSFWQMFIQMQNTTLSQHFSGQAQSQSHGQAAGGQTELPKYKLINK